MPHIQNTTHTKPRIQTQDNKETISLIQRKDARQFTHTAGWPAPEFPGTLSTSCICAGCSLSLEYSSLDPGMAHGATFCAPSVEMPNYFIFKCNPDPSGHGTVVTRSLSVGHRRECQGANTDIWTQTMQHWG